MAKHSHLPHVPRNGRTIREAAAITGLSESTIKRWTSKPRAEYLTQANEKRKRALELRAQGLSVRAIAARVGCSPAAAHRYINGR